MPAVFSNCMTKVIGVFFLFFANIEKSLPFKENKL